MRLIQLTNNSNVTSSFMKLVFQILNNYQRFSSLLDIWICTIKLINLFLGVQDKHIIMIQWWASKRNLHKKTDKLVNTHAKRVQHFQSSAEKETCFKWTARFPLQVYNRVSNSSSSGFLNPDATPPSSGIMQGLK